VFRGILDKQVLTYNIYLVNGVCTVNTFNGGREKHMERKIMSLGKSSSVISLPPEWMQLNGLEKGDSVSFTIQRDRSLVIYPGAFKKAEQKEITLSIGQNEEELLITQKILGAFLNGYSGIILTSEKIFCSTTNKSNSTHGGKALHESHGS
jgi:antitoxin component of MazEF toxin-antitoxin module